MASVEKHTAHEGSPNRTHPLMGAPISLSLMLSQIPPWKITLTRCLALLYPGMAGAPLSIRAVEPTWGKLYSSLQG